MVGSGLAKGLGYLICWLEIRRGSDFEWNWVQGLDQGFVRNLVPVFQDLAQVQNQIRGLVLDYRQIQGGP